MINNKRLFSYIDTWNEKDVDKICSLFCEEIVYVDTSIDHALTGGRIRSHVERIIEVCPDMRFEIINCTNLSQNRCAMEWLMYGNSLDPSYIGAPVSEEEPILGACFFHFKEDKVNSLNVYFDHVRRKVNAKSLGSSIEGYPKYQKSGLTEEDLLRYKQDLEMLLIDEKKYLETDLTLPKLANYMNISTNHLSQVINGMFEKNFYELVNYYRVNEAISLMKDKRNSAKSILEIAFEAGFCSSSGFYHVFKNITGRSPKEFR